MISFTIAGVPAGQGALRQNGHGGVYETTKGHKPWRQAVIAEAQEAWGGGEVWVGAVGITVAFVFPRLRGHYRTGKHALELRLDAPEYHTSTPDLDHLQRSIGDALSMAGCIRDDKQIASWVAEKRYGGLPCAQLSIYRI